MGKQVYKPGELANTIIYPVIPKSVCYYLQFQEHVLIVQWQNHCQGGMFIEI